MLYLTTRSTSSWVPPRLHARVCGAAVSLVGAAQRELAFDAHEQFDRLVAFLRQQA